MSALNTSHQIAAQNLNLESVKKSFDSLKNSFAGSKLDIDHNTPSDIAAFVITNIIDVFDSISDPDFTDPVKELSRRAGLSGQDELFISLIDLGLLGNVTIGQIDENSFALVTANITSLSCGFKEKILLELTEKISNALSPKGVLVQVQDQYEEFIFNAYQLLGHDEQTAESQVNRYKQCDSKEVRQLVQQMTDDLIKQAQSQNNPEALVYIQTTVHGKFPQDSWINPASIPSSRIEKFITFEKLSKQYPDVLFMAGAQIRSTPIAKYAPLYQNAVANGQLPLPIGSLEHSHSANTLLKQLKELSRQKAKQ
jgi:hypothetical protein